MTMSDNYYTDEDKQWMKSVIDIGNQKRNYNWQYDRTIINNCSGCGCLCFPKEHYVCSCGTECYGFKCAPHSETSIAIEAFDAEFEKMNDADFEQIIFDKELHKKFRLWRHIKIAIAHKLDIPIMR